MSGNGKPEPPETIEYVVQPLGADEGEIDLRGPDGKPITVPLTMTDLDVGLTVICAPHDFTDAQMDRLSAVVNRQVEERGPGRRFMLLRGQLGVRWHFLRLIRKDRWDADFCEERVDPAAR